ncbi:hypothetical protein [Mucilaginibacter antarcticus]|uniref:hypothetical protein n=1 Tax=Mucilaginibacter antarcticus TaxID=1855725 RepID=UPI00362ED236
MFKKVDAVLPDPAVVNPVSDYTITPDPADGFTFTFKNTSKNFTKLEWRFGDDSVAVGDNVTHTFVNTGDPNANPRFAYVVDLKTTSSTGNISHKYINLPISPEAIAQFVGVKDATTPNKINLSVNVKATIKTVEWTFTDADFPDPTVSGGAVKKERLLKPQV